MKKNQAPSQILTWADTGAKATLSPAKQAKGYEAGPTGAGEAPFYQHLNLMFNNLFGRAQEGLLHQSQRDHILAGLADVQDMDDRATLHWNGSAFVDAEGALTALTGPQRLLIRDLLLQDQDLDLSASELQLEMDGLSAQVRLNGQDLILGDASGEIRIADTSPTPGKVILKGRCNALRILTDGLATVDDSDPGFEGSYHLNGVLSSERTQDLENRLSQVEDYLSGRNLLMNADFSINQRGADTVTGEGFPADRWQMLAGSASSGLSFSRMTFDPSQTAVPGYPRYYLRHPGYAGQTCEISQKIENVWRLAGRQVTLSFWAKADSSISLGLRLEQYYNTGLAARVVLDNPTQFALTSSWQQFSLTLTLPDMAGLSVETEVEKTYTGLVFCLPDVALANVDLALPQLEYGTRATPFEPVDPAMNLLGCMRFYESWKETAISMIYYRPNSDYFQSVLLYAVPKRNLDYSLIAQGLSSTSNPSNPTADNSLRVFEAIDSGGSDYQIAVRNIVLHSQKGRSRGYLLGNVDTTLLAGASSGLLGTFYGYGLLAIDNEF